MKWEETCIKRPSGNRFYHSNIIGDNNNNIAGVGFIIHKNMGNCNSKVGRRLIDGKLWNRLQRVIGQQRWKQRYVHNEHIQKIEKRKWTWVIPNRLNRRMNFKISSHQRTLADVIVINQYQTRSDDRLVRVKFTLSPKMERKKLMEKDDKPNKNSLKIKQQKISKLIKEN